MGANLHEEKETTQPEGEAPKKVIDVVARVVSTEPATPGSAGSSPAPTSKVLPKIQPVKRRPEPTRRADLELAERALALALSVPAFPPRGGVDLKGELMEPEALKAAKNLRKSLQRELGPAWDYLTELFSERGSDIDRICHNYVRVTDPNDRFQQSFCRMLWTWGATVQHHAYRLELIDLLIDARDGILDSMRVIPVPNISLGATESRDESLGPAGVLLPPHVDDLNDTQQAILAELDKERLTCPQLSLRVRKSEPAVKKALETLRRHGCVEFVPGGGYVIRVRPRGMPPKPGAVSDPPEGVSG